MDFDRRDWGAAALSLATVVSLIAGVAVLGVTPVGADQHTKDSAEDYTEESNYTVTFPNPTDHYPGDRNAENGSIRYFFAGEDAFREIDAEEGAFIHYVILDADWIDYSACNVDNTAAFGIDRGGDNSGTQTDQDLVSRRKDDNFRDDGLTVEFYTHGDLGGDPPYMAPEDAIVAQQGVGSAGGPCLTLTDEPGWYQLQGFLNGTEADNGPDERPSDDAKHAGGTANSNYLYVCECDSRAEAEERLGPAPGDDTGSDPAPTPTPTPAPATATPASDPGETDTPAATDGSTPTQTLEPAGTDDGADTETPAGTSAPESEPASGDNVDEDERTPTPGDGPGFTGFAALLALLAAALLVRRP